MNRLIQSKYFYPIVICAICIWRIFAPQLPVNDGLGWDGYKYYQITVDGLQSSILDSYLVLRIFPCLWVRTVLLLVNISLNPPHIILAFKIMNVVLIGMSAMMVKEIFTCYKLNIAAQFTGFVLIFFNYAILNFTFYYPVMTDTPAFCLSIALLYFFIKGELLNLFLTGLIGAFTWPILFPMSLALLLFPTKKITYKPINKSFQYLLCGLAVAYFSYIGWYLLFAKAEKLDIAYCLPLSYSMLPITFISIGLLFFFMPFLLDNKTFFTLDYYKSQIDGNRIFAVVALIILFLIIRQNITVTQSAYLTFYHQIKIHLLYAFERPFMTLVCHFNYFGCGILLIIIFWKRLAAYISTFGLGVAGIVFVNLIFFCMKPESRALIHFLPWLLIFLSLYLGQYRFKNFFYGIIILANLVLSKLWLSVDFAHSGGLLPDGTIGFPQQWFYMNLGIWMAEPVWFGLLCLAVICSLLLILAAYKITFGKKALLFYKKYQPIAS